MKVLKLIVLALIITVLIFIINRSFKENKATGSESTNDSNDICSNTQENINFNYIPSDLDYNAETNIFLTNRPYLLSLDSENLKQYLISKNVNSFKILDLGNFDLNSSDIKYLTSFEELENLSLSENNLFEKERIYI